MTTYVCVVVNDSLLDQYLQGLSQPLCCSRFSSFSHLMYMMMSMAAAYTNKRSVDSSKYLCSDVLMSAKSVKNTDASTTIIATLIIKTSIAAYLIQGQLNNHYMRTQL